jgi:hypothetical protein
MYQVIFDIIWGHGTDIFKNQKGQFLASDGLAWYELDIMLYI